MTRIPTNFGFTEEHEMLRQEARRLFAERCPISEVRRLADDALGFDPGLWKELGSLGWAGLATGEQYGGAGLGFLPLALLLEEMGRRLVPSPYLASLLASFAIDAGGSSTQRARWLPEIASGTRIGTLALYEPAGGFEAENVRATAEPAEGGFVLRGQKRFVLAGASADCLVVPCREPSGEVSLFVVDLPARGVTVQGEIGVDPTRRTARVALDGVHVACEARLDGSGAAALERTHARGFVALAAEMVGAADAALVMTRDYAIARKQFGRQIGFFQAVKHPIVDVMIGVELARNHVLGAAAAFDHTPHAAEIPARMAKALASDVFATAVRKGVQLHGGYGFTIDCDMHLYFKRALWSRATLGDGPHHRRRLAAALLDRDAAVAV
ncbi:MAG: acyl-CoA/acyl-ACP dehydrogenase [Deltaproteobacteria bacterium]|nr:acyl-CoA/acyl-ACP dehydrogenase [Deltaproteobacteria bacterium]